MKELCIPTRSIAVPSEGEGEIGPEVGDQVSFQAEGRVTRTEGEKTYVEVETANGEALPEETMADPMTEDGMMPDPDRAAALEEFTRNY